MTTTHSADTGTPMDISQPDLIRLRMTLGRLGRMLRQQSDEDLSHALIALLFAIHRAEPVSAKTLAEDEGVTPPAVTRSLRRLEQLGYITRESDPSDRRAQIIRLSPTGEEMRVELLHQRDIWLSEHLRELTAEEIARLIDALPALERLTGLNSSR